MSTIIISDLHLEENCLPIKDLFLTFLKKDARHAEALYILGDFFEVWVGDDHLSAFNQSIMNALRELTSIGVPVYFMRGNRDFLIGKRFFKYTGCQVLPDEYVINLYGVPTLMMHGDTLCTQDIKYLKFRKKARHWFFQKLFLLKSLEKRLELANRYREASKNHVSSIAYHIMDVTQAEVERIMQKYNVKHLIHGHTHRQAIHEFRISEKRVKRTVLGAWHNVGNALICYPTGESEFLKII